MKEKILEILNSHNKYTLDYDQIVDILDIHQPDQLANVLIILDQLKDEYEIFINKKYCYATREQLNYQVGIYTYKTNNYGFVDNDDIHAYIGFNDSLNAFDQDEVLFKYYPSSIDDSKYDGKVIKVLKHNITTVLGYVKFEKNHKKVSLQQYNIDIACKSYDLLKVSQSSYVLFKILDYTKYPLPVKIDTIIGPINKPHIDIDAALLANQVSLTYDIKAQKEANIVSSKEIKVDGIRHDLRDLLTCTIDGDDAKDFDDAISLEYLNNGYRLYVSIADVSTYVTYGSELDKQASIRTTSIYVPDRVIPMLPFELSNGCCSLNPNVDRYTITCQIDYDEKGNVIKSYIYPSVINSNYRMTYNNVNKILDGDDKLCNQYNLLVPWFKSMAHLSNMIHHRFLREGSVDFASDELEIILDDNGRAVGVKQKESGIAQGIIEDFMISANIEVARLCVLKGIPSIYRIHMPPENDRLNQFNQLASVLFLPLKKDLKNISGQDLMKFLRQAKKSEYYDIISSRLLRAMSKAKYDSNCLGHYGLGLKYYCHFTSPIRRYPDLIVHRYLWKYYFNNDWAELEKDQQLVTQYALACSQGEVKATQIERDIIDMKCCEYLSKHIGTIYPCQIVSIISNGLYAQTKDKIDIFLPFKDSYYHWNASQPYVNVYNETFRNYFYIGDEIDIKLYNVDIDARRVNGDLYVNKKVRKKNKKVARWR